MLKFEDFKYCDEERNLCWYRYKRDNQYFESTLSFCFDLSKDDAWYQIVIGECLEDDYKEMETFKFNRLKDAIAYWNGYFGEDVDNELHFTV